MGISPAAIADYFYRSVTNTWGTTNTSQVWNLSSTAAAISGNTRFAIVENTTAGTVKVLSTDTTAYHEVAYLATGVTNLYNESLMKFTLGSISTDFGIALRRTSNSSFYAARLSGGNSVSIIVKNGDIAAPSLVQVATASFTSAAGTAYWMRFRTDSDDRLKVRVWAASVVEPTTWNVNTAAYTGSTVPTTGTTGVWFRGNSVNATHTVHAFYAYSSLTAGAEPSIPVTDAFGVSSGLGFGRASTTGHQWRGALAEEPESYGWTSSNLTATVTSGNSFGSATLVPTTPVWSFLGPDVADSAVSGKFYFQTAQTNAGVLSRATPIYTTGIATGTAYLARLGASDTLLRLYRIVSGTTTTLATFSVGAMTLPAKWVIRLQTEGTKVSAKAWLDGASEPNWQIVYTDATPITTGSGGVYMINGTAGSKVYQVSEYSQTTPIVIVWTGDSALSGASDLVINSVRVRTNYTGFGGDTNFSALGLREQRASSGVSAIASMAVDSVVQHPPQLAAAAFSGTGLLINATASKIANASTLVSAAGNLAVDSIKTISGASVQSAVSNLLVTIEASKNATASFDALGNLFADAYKQKNGAAVLSAVATAVTLTSVTRNPDAAFSATGLLLADANEFKIALSADTGTVVNGTAVYVFRSDLDAEGIMETASSVATTQIGQASISATAEAVISAQYIVRGTSYLSADTNLTVGTRRTVSGDAALSAAGSINLQIVDFSQLYDPNLRYRTTLLHKLCVRLFPNHTSVMLKHVNTSLATSSSPFVVVEGDFAVGYGLATTNWGQAFEYNPTTVVFVVDLLSVEEQILQFPVKLRGSG